MYINRLFHHYCWKIVTKYSEGKKWTISCKGTYQVSCKWLKAINSPMAA